MTACLFMQVADIPLGEVPGAESRQHGMRIVESVEIRTSGHHEIPCGGEVQATADGVAVMGWMPGFYASKTGRDIGRKSGKIVMQPGMGENGKSTSGAYDVDRGKRVVS
jgi:hypothetical protein